MKKQQQLGMNPSTAAGRLVKDILFSLVIKTEQNTCFHCGKEMSRETFSIEHKEPWLDSDDPLGLYFDLGNISFSHQSCNSSAARQTRTKLPQEVILQRSRDARREAYDPAQRNERYRTTGH